MANVLINGRYHNFPTGKYTHEHIVVASGLPYGTTAKVTIRAPLPFLKSSYITCDFPPLPVLTMPHGAEITVEPIQ